MTAPKVFGRDMDRVYGGYSRRVGIFHFHIQEQGFPYIDGGSYRGSPAEELIPNDDDKLNGYKRQTEWLESTARRIMRECFEIAGEMVATGPTAPLVIDGVQLPSLRIKALEDTYDVRFKDD